ncbi:hypothetical protein C0Q88_07370 [Ralstonia pickettii]|uniref:DUF2591 domain-containing protein n=1 Tax=Ralstonia pickettii TaxID=329 RepID=A0A2N4TXR6_RALPI|nr:phage protein NinX family protein [Ralstonia pickettii]PLC44490.1 hypothetical protein C0Q88_07370 [Ralstonia pickettii]
MTEQEASELTGVHLDMAVAKAMKLENVSVHGGRLWIGGKRPFDPSTHWGDGGPIIEREKINLIAVDESIGKIVWAAEQGSTSFSASSFSYDGEPVINFAKISVVFGPTPLIAAMRCFVIAKLGREA